jgi:hypothetical protein
VAARKKPTEAEIKAAEARIAARVKAKRAAEAAAKAAAAKAKPAAKAGKRDTLGKNTKSQMSKLEKENY